MPLNVSIYGNIYSQASNEKKSGLQATTIQKAIPSIPRPQVIRQRHDCLDGLRSFGDPFEVDGTGPKHFDVLVKGHFAAVDSRQIVT